MSENETEFRLTAELPGMAVNEVFIDFADGVLTIRGEKSAERTESDERRTYYVLERRYGAFQRALPFPGGIDESKISADFRDGVLTVHLPKLTEAKSTRRTIAIAGAK